MTLSPSQAKKMRIEGNYNKEQLQVSLMSTLQLLINKKPESLPFMKPVDPVELDIPNYFEIIKTPMDLSNIKKNLDEGVYEDAWEYVQDVWLMFNNAWKFNRKTSYVHKCAVKLAELFGTEIDLVMKGLGYCCGREYSFLAQAQHCFGKDNCVIPRNAKYYLHPDTRTFCEKCFNDLPDNDAAAIVLEGHLYCKTSPEWFNISDENVSPVSLREVLSCRAYVLLYENMSTANGPLFN